MWATDFERSDIRLRSVECNVWLDDIVGEIIEYGIFWMVGLLDGCNLAKQTAHLNGAY